MAHAYYSLWKYKSWLSRFFALSQSFLSLSPCYRTWWIRSLQMWIAENTSSKSLIPFRRWTCMAVIWFSLCMCTYLSLIYFVRMHRFSGPLKLRSYICISISRIAANLHAQDTRRRRVKSDLLATCTFAAWVWVKSILLHLFVSLSLCLSVSLSLSLSLSLCVCECVCVCVWLTFGMYRFGDLWARRERERKDWDRAKKRESQDLYFHKE